MHAHTSPKHAVMGSERRGFGCHCCNQRRMGAHQHAPIHDSPHWNATSTQRVAYWDHVLTDKASKYAYVTPYCVGLSLIKHDRVHDTKSGIAHPLLNGQRYHSKQLIESFLDDGWIGANGSACSKTQISQCFRDAHSHNCFTGVPPEHRTGNEFPQCGYTGNGDNYMFICSKQIDEIPVMGAIQVHMASCNSSIGECPDPDANDGKGGAGWNSYGAKIQVKQKKVTVCVLASYPQTPSYECETIKYQNVTGITFDTFCDMPASDKRRTYCNNVQAAMKLNANSELEFPNIDLHPWVEVVARRWMRNSLVASMQNM